jgi:CRISPR/Cas system Type II protein with McrA/HNH and RuvC-like nuclease domain
MKYNSNEMLRLKNEGKTYKEIASTLGCSEWTVKHQLIPNRKTNQRKYYAKIVKLDPLLIKKKTFCKVGNVIPFTIDELRLKLTSKPICYLSGVEIDLSKPDTYSLDHIIPVSRGGESSLENLGLVTKKINMAKYDLTPQEFLDLCQSVVTYGRPVR